MCFCKDALLSGSLQEAMNIDFGNGEQYCKSWGVSYLKIQSLMIASVLVVVFVNACLTPLLRRLVLKQKSHTRSSVVVATVNKIFMVQFFNTAVIVLLLNANLDDVLFLNLCQQLHLQKIL
jgi:hypothetical protein